MMQFRKVRALKYCQDHIYLGNFKELWKYINLTILCPIIGQSGPYTYDAAQVIAEYVKPSCNSNEYIITNAQELSKLLKQQTNKHIVKQRIYIIRRRIPIYQCTHTRNHSSYILHGICFNCLKFAQS